MLERFQYVNVAFTKQQGKSMLLKLSIKVEETLARKSRYTCFVGLVWQTVMCNLELTHFSTNVPFLYPLIKTSESQVEPLREKCPNTELFLVRIQENTDQK